MLNLPAKYKKSLRTNFISPCEKIDIFSKKKKKTLKYNAYSVQIGIHKTCSQALFS